MEGNEGRNKLNPTYEYPPAGWHLTWIPNPNKNRRELEPEIQVAEFIKEPVITWYWLIYIGPKEGHRCPPNLTLPLWQPEPSSWREATDEEMETILPLIDTGKYEKLITHIENFPPNNPEQTKGAPVPIEISRILYLPKYKLIVKKWRG